MATETHTVLIDDLDGGKAAETISYALDGVTYEIDLTKKNAAKLRSALAPFIEASRKQKAAPRAPRRAGQKTVVKPSSKPGTATAQIRAWAKENGHEVPERGRIPVAVVEAYSAAH